MPRYVRAKFKGSVFFFTVVLAERPSNLLVKEIERFRRAYRSVQQSRPFETIAICIFARSHSCALGTAGRRRRFLHALEPDQERLFTRPRADRDAIGKQSGKT